jgi:hypothetical protein
MDVADTPRPRQDNGGRRIGHDMLVSEWLFVGRLTASVTGTGNRNPTLLIIPQIGNHDLAALLGMNGRAVFRILSQQGLSRSSLNGEFATLREKRSCPRRLMTRQGVDQPEGLILRLR